MRTLEDADLPWLRDLHAQSRAEELAAIAWPAEAKRAFLDQQFAAQHLHYLRHYGDALFLAIEQDGRPVGRLYLLRGEDEHRIVDIGLFDHARNTGIGGALIGAIQADAAARGCDVALHVLAGNHAARRLYERLGFAVQYGGDGVHLPMRWCAPAAGQLKTAS
ncbi:MAG: N-acetyltransferase [Rhodanobacter denitrificans]|uniref:N-acetyltransferase n=1 Tax=Rhodanobacter denitrificans TaxID=666685 RepID=A0A2W5MYI1_9GAMM|nr:MAG: N-acetyltransferase [Rhodanobacter denitrificans]